MVFAIFAKDWNELKEIQKLGNVTLRVSWIQTCGAFVVCHLKGAPQIGGVPNGWVLKKIPSLKLTSRPWKITIFPGKYHQNGGFSIAMLVYRRVSDIFGFLQHKC